MSDCFAVLGLPDTATLEQVKLAYRKLAEVHHPDKGGAADEFTHINLAYKKACILCEQPITCSTCEGTGIDERRNGWQVAQIICPGCGGKGTVRRK